MIKANELRLPCLVEYNGEYKTMGELFNCSNNSQWSSVLLTEEWLLKMGFKQSPEFENSINKHFDIISNKRKYSFWFNFNKFTGQFWFGENELDIKHVHQVQNLYFALTGEEIEITA